MDWARKTFWSSAVGVAILFGISGCAINSTQVTFQPSGMPMKIPPTRPENIEILYERPYRSAVYLGEVSVEAGSSSLTKEQLLQEALRKAASVGAEFVEVTDSTRKDQLVPLPGPPDPLSVKPDQTQGQLGESYNLNSTPRFGKVINPTLNVRVGRFCPSRLGLIYDEARLPRFFIRAFDERSRGIRAGLRIGDEVILIDSFRIDDPRLAEHSLRVQAGAEARVSVIHENEQRQMVLIRIPNF